MAKKNINTEDLKLIYIHKAGYNVKNEGLYEFIFSSDDTNIDPQNWGWYDIPASENAMPPTEEYISEVYSLKTNSFDLFCLHEAIDREYMHGYHNIHALAFEIEKVDEDSLSSNEIIDRDDDLPLLVFHYGMSLQEVIEIFYERNIILKGNDFVEAANVKLI